MHERSQGRRCERNLERTSISSGALLGLTDELEEAIFHGRGTALRLSDGSLHSALIETANWTVAVVAKRKESRDGVPQAETAKAA